jgi:ABC-type amino acid transport substrate-binding protein
LSPYAKSSSFSNWLQCVTIIEKEPLSMKARISVIAALVLLTAACGATPLQQAQIATQTSLTTLAEGLSATDESVAEAIEEASEDAIAAARTSGGGVEEYKETMAIWYDVAVALEVAHHALNMGQTILNAWVMAEDLPDHETMSQFCGYIEEAFEQLLRALQTVNVDMPEALEAAVPHTSTICNVMGGWIDGYLNPPDTNEAP